MRENFGHLASDIITGFHGIIIGYCEYITGCNQYLLTAEGQAADSRWIDVDRIQVGVKVERISLLTKSTPGGDTPPFTSDRPAIDRMPFNLELTPNMWLK